MAESSMGMLTAELTKAANKRDRLMKQIAGLKKRIEKEDLNLVRIAKAIAASAAKEPAGEATKA